MVNFIVGQGSTQATFRVHKNLVSYYSPVLNTGFNSQFVEGTTQTMSLDDIEPAIFGELIHWMYTQDREEKNTTTLDVVDQAKLYLIAQRFLITSLVDKLPKNILDHIVLVKEGSELFDLLERFMQFAYSDAVEESDSPIKQLAIACAVGRLTKDNYQKIIDRVPEKMMRGFTMYLAGQATGPNGLHNITTMVPSEMARKKSSMEHW